VAARFAHIDTATPDASIATATILLGLSGSRLVVQLKLEYNIHRQAPQTKG